MSFHTGANWAAGIIAIGAILLSLLQYRPVGATPEQSATIRARAQDILQMAILLELAIIAVTLNMPL